MWLALSANSPIGAEPTGTVAGVCEHPEVVSALHVAPLITETVPSSMLLTYTVSVRSSTATPAGSLPTVIVGHGPLHFDTSRALQPRASITDTVFPPRGAAVGVLAVRDVDRVRRGVDRERGGTEPTGADPTSEDPNPKGAANILPTANVPLTAGPRPSARYRGQGEAGVRDALGRDELPRGRDGGCRERDEARQQRERDADSSRHGRAPFWWVDL